jgi:hypothetical protein
MWLALSGRVVLEKVDRRSAVSSFEKTGGRDFSTAGIMGSGCFADGSDKIG